MTCSDAELSAGSFVVVGAGRFWGKSGVVIRKHSAVLTSVKLIGGGIDLGLTNATTATLAPLIDEVDISALSAPCRGVAGFCRCLLPGSAEAHREVVVTRGTNAGWTGVTTGQTRRDMLRVRLEGVPQSVSVKIDSVEDSPAPGFYPLNPAISPSRRRAAAVTSATGGNDCDEEEESGKAELHGEESCGSRATAPATEADAATRGSVASGGATRRNVSESVEVPGASEMSGNEKGNVENGGAAGDEIRLLVRVLYRAMFPSGLFA